MNKVDALLIAANTCKAKARELAKSKLPTALDDAVRLAQVSDVILYGVREANKPGQINDNRRALESGRY